MLYAICTSLAVGIGLGLLAGFAFAYRIFARWRMNVLNGLLDDCLRRERELRGLVRRFNRQQQERHDWFTRLHADPPDWLDGN